MSNKHGRAAAYRQKQSEEVTLPSGVTALLRRPPLQLWLQQGRMPQTLLNVAITAAQSPENKKKAEAQAVAELLSADGGLSRFEVLKFLVEVVTYAFVEPRLVEGATGDDELDPAELETEDFNYVFQWATRTLPDQIVGKDGLTVGAVETFRKDGEREPTADAGGDVSNVSNAAPIGSDGHSG